MDAEPNYSEYSLNDLHDVERRIDREKYSDRYRLIIQEIAKREQQHSSGSFGSTGNTPAQVDDLTWSIIICGLCAMPVLSVLVHLLIWVLLPQLLLDGQYVMLFPGGTYPLGWLIGAAIGYALASKPKKFRVLHSVILAMGFFVAPIIGVLSILLLRVMVMLLK